MGFRRIKVFILLFKVLHYVQVLNVLDVCVRVCVVFFSSSSFLLSLPGPDIFLGSVWSYLFEHILVFVCVHLALSVYWALTSRRVDPLTVIPLPNLRSVSEGAQSAQH